MFAPEELADLRGVATEALSGRCDVLRLVRTRDVLDNSWTEGEQTVLSNIPCRKVPTRQTPDELLVNQSQTTAARAVTTFHLEATAVVYADDVLLYNGKRYPVAGVLDRTDQMYEHVVVYDNSKPD